MSALEDILYEWRKGPFRLSTEDSLVVMARLAHFEAQQDAYVFMKNCVFNAVGAIIDSGGYCEGPHDVADAIYRLTAERDAFRESTGDPNRSCHFEVDGDRVRTITTTCWRPL